MKSGGVALSESAGKHKNAKVYKVYKVYSRIGAPHSLYTFGKYKVETSY
jgi:hypothetical protein